MSTLNELSALCKHMLHLDKEVEAAEQWLSQLKRDRQVFSREHIPDIMADIGVNELKLDSGETIKIEQKYYANISEERAPQAFLWLKQSGNDSIIKTAISQDFGASLEDKVDLAVLKSFLEDKEMQFSEKEAVHPQTLKAFVKTQLTNEETANNFPTALFGVFVADETVVKKSKP